MTVMAMTGAAVDAAALATILTFVIGTFGLMVALWFARSDASPNTKQVLFVCTLAIGGTLLFANVASADIAYFWDHPWWCGWCLLLVGVI